jgi:hypothetical protein
MADGWATMFDDIVRRFETGTFLTALEQPGKVSRLPNSLGGDPTQWAPLAAAAKTKESLFTLLRAKAHFLMLPKTIVLTMKDDSRVEFDEAAGTGKAGTSENTGPRGAWMHIPGASDGVASVGYDLGRVSTAVPASYDILDSLYHEMTHALLWLQEFYDAEVQKLYADGVAAYAGARGVDGTAFEARKAFTEAASYYVGDRISRWCIALRGLDVLWRSPPMYRSELREKLQRIIDTYDTFGTYAYGRVPVDSTEEQIASPELSKPLRDAIDKKILDERPLTKDFADTPLAGLRDALMTL